MDLFVLNLFHIEDISRSSESIRFGYHIMHVFLKLSIGVTQMVLISEAKMTGGRKEGGVL